MAEALRGGLHRWEVITTPAGSKLLLETDNKPSMRRAARAAAASPPPRTVAFPIDALPEELLPCILCDAHFDVDFFMHTAPYVCRKWREIANARFGFVDYIRTLLHGDPSEVHNLHFETMYRAVYNACVQKQRPAVRNALTFALLDYGAHVSARRAQGPIRRSEQRKVFRNVRQQQQWYAKQRDLGNISYRLRLVADVFLYFNNTRRGGESAVSDMMHRLVGERPLA